MQPKGQKQHIGLRGSCNFHLLPPSDSSSQSAPREHPDSTSGKQTEIKTRTAVGHGAIQTSTFGMSMHSRKVRTSGYFVSTAGSLSKKWDRWRVYQTWSLFPASLFVLGRLVQVFSQIVQFKQSASAILRVGFRRNMSILLAKGSRKAPLIKPCKMRASRFQAIAQHCWGEPATD